LNFDTGILSAPATTQGEPLRAKVPIFGNAVPFSDHIPSIPERKVALFAEEAILEHRFAITAVTSSNLAQTRRRRKERQYGVGRAAPSWLHSFGKMLNW